MRIEKRKDGWDEIVTTKITIRTKGKSVFSTAGQWIEFTKQQPGLNKKGRNHCDCCQIKWEDCDPELNTYILFTDKGNKIVCEKCYRSFMHQNKFGSAGRGVIWLGLVRYGKAKFFNLI